MNDAEGCGLFCFFCLLLVLVGIFIGYAMGAKAGYIESCADSMNGVCKYELRQNEKTKETTWVRIRNDVQTKENTK